MRTFNIFEPSFEYDPKKIGIWTGGSEEHVLARMGENLDYYDGETA